MKISKEMENALLKAVDANFRADWKPYIFGYEQIGEFILFAVSEKHTYYYYDDEYTEQKEDYYTATLYESFTPDGKSPRLIYVAKADDPDVCNNELAKRLNLRALRLYRMYNQREM